MIKLGLLLSILVVLLGTFFVIYDGYDDSPGAQLIGVITTAAGVVGTVKNIKKTAPLA